MQTTECTVKHKVLMFNMSVIIFVPSKIICSLIISKSVTANYRNDDTVYDFVLVSYTIQRRVTDL